jgi:hypothetical protein
MPLTPDQRRHLEARLLEERERAPRTLQQSDEHLRTTPRDESGELSSMPFHIADEGSDAMQRELDATMVTQARALGPDSRSTHAESTGSGRS